MTQGCIKCGEDSPIHPYTEIATHATPTGRRRATLVCSECIMPLIRILYQALPEYQQYEILDHMD